MKDIRKLLHFLRPYRGLALFSLAMLLAMVVLDLSIPRLVERVIDEGVKKGDMGVVLRSSALMLGVSLLSMLVAVLNSNSSIRVGESVARDLREALFVKVQGFSFADLDGFSTGKLMVRLTSDAGAVQRLAQVTLRIGTRAPLSMIGSVALMFVTSPSLAWTMVPLLLVTGALIVFFSVKMEPLFREVQRRLDGLNGLLQENIAGARLVKAFVRAEREEARFGAANEELTLGTVRVMEFMSSMTPALTVFINIGIVLVIWFGGGQAIEGKLSLGQIVAFTNYLLATMNPLIMMTQLSNTWANGLASAGRVNEVLDKASDIVEPASPRALGGRGASSVSFRDVSFHYDGDSSLAALEGIRLEAAPGQTIAILGATGSGKSTLVNLIPRFYDASSGRVAVDGADVRELGSETLLGRIGIVPQETILFSGTVMDNIRYGRPEATEAEVVEAARVAEAHDFILRLSEGYGTRIEERGVNLSGGQKQRIAIARAIIMRPTILILDDSTSAVDVETETRIQAALGAFMKGCTTFVVAQRISTVLNADKIVVLDGGRIVAEGRHQELLAASEVYREIYDSQLGGGFHG
jgi:ATP-binding cassette, subfamily B, multidrug efflux pump